MNEFFWRRCRTGWPPPLAAPSLVRRPIQTARSTPLSRRPPIPVRRLGGKEGQGGSDRGYKGWAMGIQVSLQGEKNDTKPWAKPKTKENISTTTHLGS